MNYVATKMIAKLQALWATREQGATAVEYGLLVALIAAVIVVVVAASVARSTAPSARSTARSDVHLVRRTDSRARAKRRGWSGPVRRADGCRCEGPLAARRRPGRGGCPRYRGPGRRRTVAAARGDGPAGGTRTGALLP